VQIFNHVEGQRTTLVGLLVEKVEGSNLVFVLFQVVGKFLDDCLRLCFGLLAETGEEDFIEVDVVDDLLAFATGVFDFVAQFRFVERRTGCGDALGASGLDFLR